jgi:hypothetical protein
MSYKCEYLRPYLYFSQKIICSQQFEHHLVKQPSSILGYYAWILF